MNFEKLAGEEAIVSGWLVPKPKEKVGFSRFEGVQFLLVRFSVNLPISVSGDRSIPGVGEGELDRFGMG